MPILSSYARKKKIHYFLEPIAKDASILEIGSGGGWVGQYLRQGGWTGYVGLDLRQPADFVGDIRDWRTLGLAAESFDYMIAFEVVEHVDCFQECYDLLKPTGKLLLTSPVPKMDWVMKWLEIIGLNQKRTSPHDFLVDLTTVDIFPVKRVRLVAGLSQWGVFAKQ